MGWSLAVPKSKFPSSYLAVALEAELETAVEGISLPCNKESSVLSQNTKGQSMGLKVCLAIQRQDYLLP